MTAGVGPGSLPWGSSVGWAVRGPSTAFGFRLTSLRMTRWLVSRRERGFTSWLDADRRHESGPRTSDPGLQTTQRPSTRSASPYFARDDRRWLRAATVDFE